MNNIEKSSELFNERHFHCSQAVFGAFAEELGISEELALKIGGCFGAGMNEGEVYETLSSAAKGYVAAKAAEEENITLKAECLSLQNENEALKAENVKITAQYQELDMNYGAYYDETANERELIKDNDRLKYENRCIGNQVHTLTEEVSSLKEENSSLQSAVDKANSTITAKETEIHALTAELAEKKTLLQLLQQKFDRVMEFLRIKNLKEEWEKFLAPITHQKSR